MKSILRKIEVRPRFTLDPIQRYLTAEVSKHRAEIDEQLKRMAQMKDWQVFGVSASKIPILMTHRKKSGESAEAKELGEMYFRHDEIALTTPYLIGCVEQYPEIVFNALQGIQSLEVIEAPDGCIIDIFGRKSQLCIRRNERMLSVAFSRFTRNLCIRADESSSDSTVMYLTTSKTDVLREEMLRVATKLGSRMIG